MTFKDLGTDDLGIYSCDVTDTDGIASSYVIDEDGEFKISSSAHRMSPSFLSPSRVTFVLVVYGLMSSVSPYRTEAFAGSQPGTQVPK